MSANIEPFGNRTEAGKELGKALLHTKTDDCLVLGIPRGGVIVAAEVAKMLDCRLDVIVPRKIGAPGQEELAIGAVASWGNHDAILDDHAIKYLRVPDDYVKHEIDRQLEEIHRRLIAYRGTEVPPRVEGCNVILVDDGIATGYTTRAAAIALRNLKAARITLAIPVGPPDSLHTISSFVDEIVCLKTPWPFMAVGYWYIDFSQVSDDEVVAVLQRFPIPKP